MDLQEFLAEWHSDSPTVEVHTSGSTGMPKPLQVEKFRMEASARITCSFLSLKPGDTALLCLPLDYIAGKMMVVRALTCGLQLVSVKPAGLPQWEGPVSFAAMVPLQVWNLLHDVAGKDRLRQVRHLIIGGGAIDESLAALLADFPNYIWSTYGMTETLSHIALRRLNGPERSDWYTPFEGVQLALNAEHCLVIDAPAVHDGPLVTNDIAELNEKGFRILGRKDNVICSGGIKIQIEEVERMLRPHLQQPFMISRAPDERLGQQVVMLLEQGDMVEAEAICRQVLPPYWRPRRIFSIAQLPMTSTGKPARAEAEKTIVGLVRHG